MLAEVSKPMEAFGFEQAQKEYTLQSFGRYIFILIYFFTKLQKEGSFKSKKSKENCTTLASHYVHHCQPKKIILLSQLLSTKTNGNNIFD